MMIECSYVIFALMNAASNFVSSHLGRKQQEKLSQINQETNQQLEDNRQNFQMDLHFKNVESQKNLSKLNHVLRLKEQQINFENTCKSAEWQKFLSTWPLITVPSVIREQQINKSNSTVSLRVFLSKSNNRLFNEAVYPEIEQSLKDFTDVYANVLHSNNIIYYHNAWIGTVQGGSVNENLFYALKELPTLIIDTNIVSDVLYIGLTIWGFGSDEKKQMTVFTIPFEQKITDNKIDKEYYKSLASHITNYLKFIIGYTYDTYNLLQYDTPPLLPKMIEYEQTKGNRNILDNNELAKSYQLQYGEMYNYILGDYPCENYTPYNVKDFKKTYIHLLRLEFAVASRHTIDTCTYINYLHESLDAWCQLRTKENAKCFVEYLLRNNERIPTFCSIEDVAYFEKLIAAYQNTNVEINYIIKFYDLLKTANFKKAKTFVRIIEPETSKSDSSDIFRL